MQFLTVNCTSDCAMISDGGAIYQNSVCNGELILPPDATCGIIPEETYNMLDLNILKI